MIIDRYVVWTTLSNGTNLPSNSSETLARPQGNEEKPRVSNQKLEQLFARILQEVEEKRPGNVIYFLVDFLCKNYGEHLGGFARAWDGDGELEKDKLEVIEFFRFQKIPVKIAYHFIAEGFDTLETLCTVTQELLPDIERSNQASWLQGHRIRLLQTFSDICNRIRVYRQEKEKLYHMARLSGGQCDHPTIVTRTNAIPMYQTSPIGGPSRPSMRILPLHPHSIPEAMIKMSP